MLWQMKPCKLILHIIQHTIFWVLFVCDFNILLQVDETNVQYPLSLCQLVNVDKFNEYSAKEENKSTDPNTDLSTKAITWSNNSKGIMVDPIPYFTSYTCTTG